MGVLVPIKDGRLHFGGRQGASGQSEAGSLASVIQTLYARMAARDGVTVPPLTEIATGRASAVVAQINRNRWCAECPDCGGAEFVWLETPLFLCASCWNAAVGGEVAARAPAQVPGLPGD